MSLSALYSLQEASRENSILPIWHNIERQQVVESLPFLANIIALNTSSNTFQEIVEKIIVKTQSENIVDIKKHIPTGISMLDTILSGGLPRPSSTSLIGVKGIGKSTLATQIQISALFRGEPCIYITYREPPFDIIERFFRLDAPVEEFISKGLLRILDNFSEINGISQKEVEQCISNKTISDAIVRINNPRDSENYYKKQLAIMDDMGTGGINIIDSVNERYDLIDTEDKSLHFKRFRARVKLLQHSAIHIVTETKEHDPYNDMIKDIQGGTIKMYTVEESGVIHRKIQVDSMRDGHYVPFERTFSITDKGIEIY